MTASDASSDQWRKCSSCKKPIVFGADYYVCNVSTCNRGSKGFVFCTVSCWDAHLGIVRHRESWAEDAQAPTREAHAREQAGKAKPAPASKPAASSAKPRGAKREPRRIIRRPAATAESAPHTATADPDDLPKDILVVVSKLKNYVKAKAGINCSDRVAGPISDAIRALCDEAIENALADERKTLLDRDFKKR
ncbi:MAG: hypothetical protein QF570_14855 [Myxococcota bacterium]|nr:hypothetical protein [Myxococcota bacterium]